MNLLIENPVQKDSLSNNGIVRSFIAFIVLAVMFALVNGVYHKIYGTEKSFVGENVPRQSLLESLYAQEAMPIPPQGKDNLNYGLENNERTAEGISGYILFTSVPTESNKTNQVYLQNAAEKEMDASLFLPSYVSYNAFIEVTDLSEPVTFFGDALQTALTQMPKKASDTIHRVQRYSLEDGSLKAYASVEGEYVQNLDWTEETQLLAFNRLSVEAQSYVDLLPIENWEVVISDLATDRVKAILHNAIQPKWSPDGSKILMLKSDGLYIYDVARNVQKKVLDITEGKLLATSMFDISPDGSRLIWTVGKKGVVVVYEITSWESFKLAEIGRIHVSDTEYYNPQFSPDGNYYVVQAINKAVDSGERENPRFEIRGVEGRNILRTYPLGAFDFNSFFTDTWIKRLPEQVISEPI